jgi:RNA polymerase sigma factor (sigma-70 family)
LRRLTAIEGIVLARDDVTVRDPSRPSAELDDKDLVAGMAEGDEEAFAAAYDRHADVVFGSLVRFLGDHQTAEEILQDAYLVVWRQAGRYEPSGSLVGWLLRIAHNKAIDRLRATARRPHLVILTSAPDEHVDAGLDRAAATARLDEAESVRGQEPETEVTRRWSRAVVRSALSGMTDQERRVLELAYDEELTQVEIAERLGWPLGTVKSRTRRALATMRSALEGVPGLRDGADDSGTSLPAAIPPPARARRGSDAAR